MNILRTASLGYNSAGSYKKKSVAKIELPLKKLIENLEFSRTLFLIFLDIYFISAANKGQSTVNYCQSLAFDCPHLPCNDHCDRWLLLDLLLLLLLSLLSLLLNEYFLNVLAVPSKTVFCTCAVPTVIPICFNLLPNCLGIAPKEPITNGMTFHIPLTFHIFCNFLPSLFFYFILLLLFNHTISRNCKINYFTTSLLPINYNQIWSPNFYNIISLNTEIAQDYTIFIL